MDAAVFQITGEITEKTLFLNDIILVVDDGESLPLRVKCVFSAGPLFRLCGQLEVGDEITFHGRFPTAADGAAVLVVESFTVE